MNETPRVILSGFADESANNKTAVEQFVAFAALGLQYYSIRFIDAGQGVKNVMKLSVAEIQKIRQLQNEYGLNVSSIGSPIGKVKLLDVEDGTKNVYVPFEKYLAGDVQRACELAHAFETKLIRGFSFYHPKGSDPREHLAQVVDRLGHIAEAFHRSDLTFGLEVEANLVGSNGLILAEIYRQVNHPAMVLIFDGGNILTQGFSTAEVFEQYLAMKPGLGWIHIKDYRGGPAGGQGRPRRGGQAGQFRARRPGRLGPRADPPRLPPDPAGAGEQARTAAGIPGVFLDLEPHLKGGGQFGGFSGPDGMGVALRGLCRVLDYVGIDYHLRDFDDVRAAQGFLTPRAAGWRRGQINHDRRCRGDAVGWVKHGPLRNGALREPAQNRLSRSQRFDSVRNPPFPRGSLHAPYS